MMSENSMLRISLIMQDKSATTVEKYICKLVEFVLYNSESKALSAVELCKNIKEQFKLEFDVQELKMAIKNKSKGRIFCDNSHNYVLSDKVKEQLSKQTDPITLLKKYIKQFLKECNKTYNCDNLLITLQEYLYYAFNSNLSNLLELLENKSLSQATDFNISNEMVIQINDFISWDNEKKDELLYNIISFSYDYCMLTVKKDMLLSSKIFRGKRFFLDTNIIFRMTGINKDERQFVTESFVKKCNEVGIELFYTSETLCEIYRVLEGQVKIIRSLTRDQEPLSPDILKKFNDTYEINDFYVYYYNWCKKPNNDFNDLNSFHHHLLGKIRKVIGNLNYVEISNLKFSKHKDLFETQCSNLDEFKKNKRANRINTPEALQTDINNILYILSLRKNAQSQNLWQTNDFIVSADQLLTKWAQTVYTGVPIVVIPSTWLSIMLRFSGRSSDDYKSYCLFMGLRQHREDENNISINTVELLKILSQKTSEVEIKQRIIEEILNNKNIYNIQSSADYSVCIDNAFEKIISRSSEKVLAIINSRESENQKTINELSEELKKKSTEEEYSIKIANAKANKNIQMWKKLNFLQILLPAITILTLLFLLIIMLFKFNPFYDKLSSILNVDFNEKNTFIVELIFSLLGAFINFVVIAPLKYMSSEERKKLLMKKYLNENKKYLKYELNQ